MIRSINFKIVFKRWIPFFVFSYVSLIFVVVILFFPDTISSHSNRNNTQVGETKNLNRKLVNTLKLSGSLLSIKNTSFYKSRESINEAKESVELLETSNEPNNNNNTTTVLNDTLKELSGSLMSLRNTDLYRTQTKQNGFSQLIKKTASLFKNPVYVFVIIAGTIEGLLQNSFLAFVSLFLEYQYRLAAGTSSLVVGLLSLPPVIVGGILSGIICKKLNDNVISCFKFLAFILFLNVILYAGFLIHCEESTLISSTFQAYSLTSNRSTCYSTASDCGCDLKIFKPVCLSGSRDIYFQSPCLAGCQSLTSNSAQFVYSNCTQNNCDNYFDSSAKQDASYFVDGLCPSDSCGTRLLFSYGCIFLLMLMNALLFLPYLKVTIGSVDSPEMNTIVLGLKQFFMNAFGTIPGPILFGSVIDTTCSYWHTDSHGQHVCKMYNNRNFALGFGLLGMGFKAVCFVLIILSLVFSTAKRRRLNNSK